MKVFVIGWSKTGTTSLGDALTTLGLGPRACYDAELVLAVRDGNMDKVFEVAEQHQVFEDWPWPLVYQEMAERYPAARFILTVRDHKARFASYNKHVAREEPQTEEVYQAREFYFGHREAHRHTAEVTHRYIRHIQTVTRYFAAERQPSRLLVVDITKGAGWDEICGFLNMAVPDAPFPNSNKAPFEA